ncbi:MAG: GTPase HflX [Anaerolineaceae bacterium 4572_32.2]|nr:MAG: GTPase HflX [Anaerolineaceae bacterium 4572_32.2]HEY72136.1 GTPase HflX [Thermoflexia bacterium]
MKGPAAHSLDDYWPVEESLDELAQLARTAGIGVVGQMMQRLERPNPATFIGPGKVEELAEEAAQAVADVVIFDDELSPRHQRELERVLGDGIKLLDRTALILDIFAQHARTREGALQVELAQYEYRLPRLTRAWTHLARQAGGRAGGVTGGVGVRGPGETQLETDRRVIGRRIAQLKRELEKVRAHRGRHRARRRREGIPVAAIVGYTNAGKSTLLNSLAGADVLAEDKLFATLDPTTRRVELPGGGVALFTDTVGFIQKLPTQLVAAFRATLEEVVEADLLLHVMDITHPQVMRQAKAVDETLEEIGAAEKPTINVLNKIDRLPDPKAILPLASKFPASVAISALTGVGLESLLSSIEEILERRMVRLDVFIPYEMGELVDLFHRRGLIEQKEHIETGTRIAGRIPRGLLGRFHELME